MPSLAELAATLKCELRGDGASVVTRVAPIETASPGDITFLANPKYRPALALTKASAVIMAPDEAFDRLPTLRTREPYLAFARAVEILHPLLRPTREISPLAYIATGATLGRDLAVGSFCHISEGSIVGDGTSLGSGVFLGKNVRVGARCHFYPGVAVLDDCVIGDDVILHAGVVIGSDGFGYAPGPQGLVKIRQIGNVVIGDRVEIGANCCVDRAALGSTRIGSGTKIDNLAQIAHNVEIGENCVIVAQVGISGSSKLEDRVTLGGQVGVAGHLTIGAGSVVAAQSGVPKDVPPGTTMLGSPAHEISHQRKVAAVTNNLPELLKRVRALEKEAITLRESLNSSLYSKSKEKPS